MSTARFVVGDTRTVVASLPDDSVDLVMTSPPFLALRSYLPADDPNKSLEIGSEPDPATFLDVLLELTAEWGRVLAPHGSICVELGDTYAGSGGAGGDDLQGGWREGQRPFGGSMKHARVHDPAAAGPPIQNRDGKRQGGGPGWPLPKSLTMTPELYRVALAYGVNPLTGAESPAGRWRVRNVVRWVRPNPPVGALGDKFRPATSELVVATKATDRWFDLDAVRAEDTRPPSTRAPSSKAVALERSGQHGKGMPAAGDYNAHGGAPPLDWWEITNPGYPGAHYATYPPELCRIPIEAMCPRQVCVECGQPRRRITEATYEAHGTRRDEPKGVRGHGVANGEHAQHMTHGRATKGVTTVGWSDCGHGNFRPGVVLDPFAGTGTTLVVATGHGRDAIGVDIDARNADLARERLGMFLTVDEFAPITIGDDT